MRGALLGGGAVIVMGAWTVAASHSGMVGHMTAHMLSVAIAAPLIALGLRGGRFDPALRLPWLRPLGASLVELVVVWGWHLPAARRFAQQPIGLAIEQATFLLAGLALWSAVLGAAGSGTPERRAAGVGALLLTSMHMTLLGVLIGLAPQPLYPQHHAIHGLTPLEDQQLGGVVMLVVGTGSYLLGGLAMLATLLRRREDYS